MIRKATSNDKTALRKIWCAAFGDDPDYAAFVTDHCLELGTVLYHPGGMSCLTLFPVNIYQRNRLVLEGVCVYGLATHPLQQKKGFGSLLLARALAGSPFVLLYPATESLQKYYLKRGFDTRVRIPAPLLMSDCKEPNGQATPDELYSAYKNDAQRQEFAFLWPFSIFNFAFQECLFRGGYVAPPWFCYPSEKDRGVLCKLYKDGGKKDGSSYLHALVHFNVPVPGFCSEDSIFYLPLD
ncbi:MAG TPA: GNAT family N-acetyltransferase [Bacteroidales bacterium]|nr:GNAT family N-acetyltransferase [Bacteroidales bacterium]